MNNNIFCFCNHKSFWYDSVILYTWDNTHDWIFLYDHVFFFLKGEGGVFGLKKIGFADDVIFVDWRLMGQKKQTPLEKIIRVGGVLIDTHMDGMGHGDWWMDRWQAMPYVQANNKRY